MDISKCSRVCMVLLGCTAHCLQTQVFIFNLEGGLEGPLIPNVRLNWDHFNEPAVCVIGSKLFVFQAYLENVFYHLKFKSDAKAVYTFDLGSSISNLVLDKSMMCKEAESLNHFKVQPNVTVTPDGKILLFSSLIITSGDTCDFELYDPKTRKWHKLPNLPVTLKEHGPKHGSFFVKDFSIVRKNVFFLRTEVGIFTLNLKNPKKWEMSGFHWNAGLPYHRGDRFFVIGKQICLMPFSAFDIRVRGTRCPVDQSEENIFARLDYTFPEMLTFSHIGSFSSNWHAMTLLHQEERKDFSVCTLEAAVNDKSKKIEVLLQVYHTDLPTCLKELSACRKKKVKEHRCWKKLKCESLVLPGTSKVKTILFSTSEGPDTKLGIIKSFSSIV